MGVVVEIVMGARWFCLLAKSSVEKVVAVRVAESELGSRGSKWRWCRQGWTTKKSSVAELQVGRSVAWERAGRPSAERVTGGREVSGRWRVVRGGSGK